MNNSISLISEKGPLSLLNKRGFQYEQNSPFFGRDSLRSTFSSVLEVVGDNEGTKALEHAELLESKIDKLPNIRASLLSDGIEISKGLLISNKFTVDRNERNVKTNCLFVSELGEYADKIEGLTLKDLKVMEDEYIQGDNVVNIDSINSNNIRGEATNLYCSDILINNSSPYYTFPTMKVDDEHYEYVNLWDDNNSKFRVVKVEGPILGIGNDIVVVGGLVPMFYYKAVLKACFEEFGYKLQDDFIESFDFGKLVIVNNNCILKQRVLQLYDELVGLPDPLINEQYCELDTVISAKNHLPEITIKDFLNDFMICFGASFDIKNDVVKVKQLKGNSVKKNTDVAPRYIREINKKQPFTLKYDYSEDQLKFNLDCVEDYSTGEGIEYISQLVPVFHDLNNADGFGTAFMADMRLGVNKTPVERWDALIQSGSPPLFPIDAINTLDPFHVMDENIEMPKMKGIFHGLTNTGYSSYTYPVMNAYAAVDDQTLVYTNGFSLFWLDVNSNLGLIEVFLKHWIRIQNSEIKDIFYFNDSYLEYLENDWENFKIIGNQEYYIAKKRAQLPLRKEVEYECYKL